jgi:hypothetical protein
MNHETLNANACVLSPISSPAGRGKGEGAAHTIAGLLLSRSERTEVRAQRQPPSVAEILET